MTTKINHDTPYFDMSTASISEVRVVVRTMAKAGLSMGIDYLINQKNQKVYIGSTLNLTIDSAIT